QLIEPLALGGMVRTERKQLDEPRHADHDEMNGRRFQRFDKTAGKPDSYTIADPGLAAAASAKADREWSAQRSPFQRGEELIERRIGIHVVARIDEARAHTVLQRDAPLPAGGVCDGACVRIRWLGRLALGRPGGICRQPTRPVL